MAGWWDFKVEHMQGPVCMLLLLLLEMDLFSMSLRKEQFKENRV
jgi:hypothetical protein